jgi:hypothetical protein
VQSAYSIDVDLIEPYLEKWGFRFWRCSPSLGKLFCCLNPVFFCIHSPNKPLYSCAICFLISYNGRVNQDLVLMIAG